MIASGSLILRTICDIVHDIIRKGLFSSEGSFEFVDNAVRDP